MPNQELQNQIDALREEFYANNFKTSQDFNKYSRFNSRLKVPSYAVAPTTCEVGEIIEVGGKLKICSASNTWTTVGTQV
jgi:hypothetical protein